MPMFFVNFINVQNPYNNWNPTKVSFEIFIFENIFSL